MGIRKGRQATDWLREMSGALVFAMIAVGVGTLLTTCASFLGSITVSAASDLVIESGALTGLTGGASLDPNGAVELVVDDPTVKQGVLHLLTWLPTATVVLIMLGFLLRIVRIARQDPFRTAVLAHLRSLGIVVIIAGPLSWGVEFFASFALVGTVTAEGSSGRLELQAPLVWMLVGMGYFAIAEVVKRGTAMRAELDEVI
ncbi:MAG: DUF2975 domain-containing protein [Dactylosporangium sp.]|nr:DUF2975 domain-containing protein [Dactylosporangium sp.]NNJ63781.1 DUF2975 domain-containing protein [Dactylosporangium sp.]